MLAALLPVLLAAVAPNAPLRVAVYELKSAGVEAQVAKLVTTSVTAELRKLDGLAVIGMDEAQAMLDHEAERQLVGCADDGCLAEIASALGVDEIVVGSIALVGGSEVFGLKRLDLKSGETRKQVDQRLSPGNGEELLAVIGPAVEALYPDVPLKPGRVRGVSKELALALNPPPLDPWAFWAAATTTGAATLVAAGAIGFFAYTWTDYKNLAQLDVIDADVRQEKASTATSAYAAAWTAGGVAGLCAIGTGVAYAFTDWDGLKYGVHVEAQE